MLSNTAVPRYYGAFRDAVLRGDIHVCKEVAMEMWRIDRLIESPGYYNDIWYFPALAMWDTVIEKDERICQFRILRKMAPVTLEMVACLDGPDRGGLGSTGTK